MLVDCTFRGVGVRSLPVKECVLCPGRIPNRDLPGFRGKRELLPDFRLTGPDVDDVVNAENEGLRIRLPKTRQDNSQNIEVAANFVITGDFEITGTFELLHADMPTDGWGVGVCLSLSDTHTIDKFLKVGRYMRPKTGSVFYAESWTKGAKDLKNPSVKTEARKGQLRLVREGQMVRCQFSENIGKEFITLFTREDSGDRRPRPFALRRERRQQITLPDRHAPGRFARPLR